MVPQDCLEIVVLREDLDYLVRMASQAKEVPTDCRVEMLPTVHAR